MTHQEFTRLRTFEKMVKRRFRPSVAVTSRRTAKTGGIFVHKLARVQYQVPLERHFIKHP